MKVAYVTPWIYTFKAVGDVPLAFSKTWEPVTFKTANTRGEKQISSIDLRCTYGLTEKLF